MGTPIGSEQTMLTWAWSKYRCVFVESTILIDFRLPFVLQNTCALALAVNTYLDDVATGDVPSSVEAKAASKKRLQKDVFIYAENYEGDLKKAFQLWDAVYAGIKAAGDLFKDRKLFDETDKWLVEVR